MRAHTTVFLVEPELPGEMARSSDAPSAGSRSVCTELKADLCHVSPFLPRWAFPGLACLRRVLAPQPRALPCTCQLREPGTSTRTPAGPGLPPLLPPPPVLQPGLHAGTPLASTGPLGACHVQITFLGCPPGGSKGSVCSPCPPAQTRTLPSLQTKGQDAR